jgi:hypothetical protein
MLDHIERNWVQYLVAFIVVVCISVWAIAFTQWLTLPQCTTIAEYGGSNWRNLKEGAATYERVGNAIVDCKVGRYLP